MNSRNKGKVGEREFAALLREHGFDARRGQQFAGGAESPDVVCEALAWLHIEVKRVQNLNLTDACVQAEGDQTRSGLTGTKKLAWIVAHRRNHAPWLITMTAETFFRLVRGELPPSNGAKGTKKMAWVVADRRNHASWLITMRAETFFRLLRGELPPSNGAKGTGGNIQHRTANHRGRRLDGVSPHRRRTLPGGEREKIWDAQQHVPTTENTNQKQKEQNI